MEFKKRYIKTFNLKFKTRFSQKLTYAINTLLIKILEVFLKIEIAKLILKFICKLKETRIPKNSREVRLKQCRRLTYFLQPPPHAPLPQQGECSSITCFTLQIHFRTKAAMTKGKTWPWNAEVAQTLISIRAGKR